MGVGEVMGVGCKVLLAAVCPVSHIPTPSMWETGSVA
jgi:hypothetical protein